MTSVHPRGDGALGMSSLLLGQRPSIDLIVGYPVHRVEVWKGWSNPHGTRFVDWRATCGATGTGSPGCVRPGVETCHRKTLCTKCWGAKGRVA